LDNLEVCSRKTSNHERANMFVIFAVDQQYLQFNHIQSAEVHTERNNTKLFNSRKLLVLLEVKRQ
jgi:hypothetical protein